MAAAFGSFNLDRVMEAITAPSGAGRKRREASTT